MNGYREVFKPTASHDTDPGRIFYTLTEEDVRRTTVYTTAGPIHLADFFGAVRFNDVGKRLYRVPTNGGIPGQPVSWIWQAENDEQRDKRVNKGRVVHVRNDSAEGQAVTRAQDLMRKWHEHGFSLAPIPADGKDHPTSNGRFPNVCPVCTVTPHE